jgi:putative NIF3 family GTP cyclohydrolase 1 type 2
MSNINDILKSAKKQSLYTEFDSLVSSGEVYTKYMYIAREKKTNVFKIGHTNNLLTRLRCMNTFSYNGFKYLATVKFTGDIRSNHDTYNY